MDCGAATDNRKGELIALADECSATLYDCLRRCSTSLERWAFSLNNPSCPACQIKMPWGHTLRSLLGPSRQNQATWGVDCPHCGAHLKVMKARVMLIAAAGIFFGSQSSTLLVLNQMTAFSFWIATLWLILGFYAVAIFVLLKLETIE